MAQKLLGSKDFVAGRKSVLESISVVARKSEVEVEGVPMVARKSEVEAEGVPMVARKSEVEAEGVPMVARKSEVVEEDVSVVTKESNLNLFMAIGNTMVPNLNMGHFICKEQQSKSS